MTPLLTMKREGLMGQNKINRGLKEYNEQLKQGLVIRSKQLSPIEKSKLNPKSLRFALNAKCFDCSGFKKVDVTECDMPDCELYHLRPWQRPHKKITINGVDTLLSKSSTMTKNSCSDSKIPQERFNSTRELLPPYAQLRANPKSLRAAINAFCFWCSCEQRKEVKYCTCDCPLHHLRPWQPKNNISESFKK